MTTRTHTLSFGTFELTVFDDGRFTLPAGYFANVPPSLSEGLDGTLTIGANLWYIRTGDRRILVDTGSANALKAMFSATGQAWDDLNQESPTDIVLTHMHADHLGAFAEGAIFPDAKVHVAKAEWELWTNEGLVDAVPEDQRPMVQMSSRSLKVLQIAWFCTTVRRNSPPVCHWSPCPATPPVTPAFA